MAFSSFVGTSKYFKFTSLTMALALAGCGGGDGGTVDAIAPAPDLGVKGNSGNGNNGNTNSNNGGNTAGEGGETTGQTEPDFFIQKITAEPGTIQLDKEPKQFTIVVKAVQKATGGAVANKEVTVSVADSESSGVTINGSSTQVTDGQGNATYQLTLNPNAVADRQQLLANGIKISATATAADGSERSQLLNVGVSVAGDEDSVIKSDIELNTALNSTSLSKSAVNPFGDSVAIRVQAKRPNGATASGVDISLGINNIDGVTIVGGNNKKTDDKGQATFNIVVADSLTAEQRKALISSGIAYNVRVTEANGATISEAGTWSVVNPTSDYNVAVTGNAAPLSAFGAKQTLQITATAKSSRVPTTIGGSVVKIALNNAPKGVRLSQNQLKLDENGRGSVDVIVAENLTQAQKDQLVKTGISYTVTLMEPNKANTVKTAKSSVYIPEAALQLSFDNSDKKQLSSSGGTATITFRVNDKNGGPVAGQTVVASLPSVLKSSSLVTLDSEATQQTDAKGIVSYTVRVPAGLTETQKAQLEKVKSFSLGVSLKEESGVVSTKTSQPISISPAVGKSDIELSAKSSVDSVNVLGDSFKVLVTAVNKSGGAAPNQEVKLIISGTSGVSIAGGNTQTTNTNGVAEFTVNLSDSLSAGQRQKLINEGINYLAILTAADGTQSKVSSSVAVAQPTPAINISSINSTAVNELGGSSEVVVQLVDSKNAKKPIKNKAVSIALTNAAKLKGVTVAQNTATTDIEGKAIFVINLPANLTPSERASLKASGITYQVSYESNGQTYQSGITSINITAADVSLTVLNPETVSQGKGQYELSNTGDIAVVKSQLINSANDKPLVNQAVELVLNNPQIAKLLTVNGQVGSSKVTATTDDNGVVSFDIVVPNNLTEAQRNTLKRQALTATMTESLTGKKTSVGVTIKSIETEVKLIAATPQALNLNGGETIVRVVAQDLKGNVVANQRVSLALPSAIAQQGITIASSPNQATNASGVATFTIAAPSGLTAQQKAAISDAFVVGIGATDANGNTEAKTVTVRTEQPAATKEQLTLGANKVVNTDGDNFKVFARITDEQGNGISGTPVQLAVAEPVKTGVSITGSNTVTTNGDGVAEFNLTLQPGANVNKALLEEGIKLRASAKSSEGVALKQDYIVNVDTSTIDSYVIMTAADKTTLNTGGDQTEVTFRIVDNQGGVLAGVPVQLSIDNPKQSGAALTTTSIVTSDEQGLITAGVVLGASSVNARLNHNVTVKAKVVTAEYDEDGSPLLNTRAEEQIILQAVGTSLNIEATKTNLQAGEQTTITSKLVDAAGIAISNADVELVDIEGNKIVGTSTVRTNDAGVATFSLDESKLNFDENGNLRVRAKAIGEQGLVTQTSSQSVSLVQVSQAGISFSEIKSVYNVNESNNLKIQIRSDNPQALVGEQVEVQTTLGEFANGEVITSKAITDDMIDGNSIVVPIELTSELAGTAVLTARVVGQTNGAGQALTTTVDTRFRATTPAKMLLQSVKSVITPGGSTEIVALVKDANDVPVEGVTVVFSRSSDSSAGRLSAATAVTNAQGEARVTYQANAGSPINGVVINAELLADDFSIGQKQTSITVSDQAVYTTLAFSDTLDVSSDNIYYIKNGSIAVMDGSGRPIANQQVSLKSYATQFSQGLVCLAERNVSYQPASKEDAEGNKVIPEVQTSSKQVIEFSDSNSNWLTTEDPEFNYILDQGDDLNSNGQLDPINPVTILGGTLADDEYTFVTDNEGKVDFQIRYPKMYSHWTTVRFDATTLVNGSENMQSFNVQLSRLDGDVAISNDSLITPYVNNASPFGIGDAVCINRLSIAVDDENGESKVTGSVRGLSSTLGYSISLDNKPLGANGNIQPANPTFAYSFKQAFEKGSLVTVNVGSSSTSYVISTEDE